MRPPLCAAGDLSWRGLPAPRIARTISGDSLDFGGSAGTIVYMNMYNSFATETVSDTRRRLTGHVARFRSEGLEAEPVVFGDRRHADAVLLPFETFRLLLDIAEDLVIGERIREREAADTGRRTSLRDAATEFDIDLDQL